MMNEREICELKYQRAVAEASLTIPNAVVETSLRCLVDCLRERSGAYAGPMPVGDRGLYKEWALRREAFEFLVVRALERMLGRGL